MNNTFDPQGLPIGKLFHLDTYGRSMHSLIREGDVLIAQRVEAKDLSIGDIAVFKSEKQRESITHRLISKRRKNGKIIYLFKGDGLMNFDKPVSAESIVGKVLVIERGEKRIELNTLRGRLISWFFFLLSLGKSLPVGLFRLLRRQLSLKRRLQNFVLKTSNNKILNCVYRAYYILAIKSFKFIFSSYREIESIYLRRQMAKGTWQPGLSDIDLSAIIKEMPYEREEYFLKSFWRNYLLIKKIFPFLGEVEITTKRELKNWQLAKGVRSQDISNWRNMYGQKYIPDTRTAIDPEIVILGYLTEAMHQFWAVSIDVWEKRKEGLHLNEFRTFFNHLIDTIRFIEKIDKKNIPEGREHFLSKFVFQNEGSRFCQSLKIFFEKIRKNTSKVDSDLLLDLYCHLVEYLDEKCSSICKKLSLHKKQESLNKFLDKPLSEKIDINEDKVDEPWQNSVKKLQESYQDRIVSILSNSHVFGNHSFIVLKEAVTFEDARLVYRKAAESVVSKYVCLVTKNILQAITYSLFMETAFNYWNITQQASIDFGIHPREYLKQPCDDILYNIFKISVGQLTLYFRIFPINRIPSYLLYHSIDHIVRLRLALDKKIITSSLRDAVSEYKIQYPGSNSLRQIGQLEKYLHLNEVELSRLSNERIFYENFEFIHKEMAALNGIVQDSVIREAALKLDVLQYRENIKEIKNSNVRCIKPWTTLFIKDNEIKVCCWSKQALAKLEAHTSLSDFWNSEVAQFVRRKMLEADTDEICPETCPILNDRSDNFSRFEKCQAGFTQNEKTIYKHIKNLDVVLESKPFDIGVIIDHVCNLKCKMCFIFENPDYVVRDGFYRIVDDAHDALRHIYLIGGEPFFSKRTLNFINDCIYKDYKFKFGFVTNLTIFDKELLSKIGIDGFCVSIDGVTKKTYEKIRRGARWEKVLDNLKGLIQLRDEHPDKFAIKVAFLVMTSNFREIPEAIELFEPTGVWLEFPPIIRKQGDPENIFEREEYYDEFMKVIEEARRKTHQEMVLNSLNVMENILRTNFIDGKYVGFR